jgi:hypothetical protein
MMLYHEKDERHITKIGVALDILRNVTEEGNCQAYREELRIATEAVRILMIRIMEDEVDKLYAA